MGKMGVVIHYSTAHHTPLRGRARRQTPGELESAATAKAAVAVVHPVLHRAVV
jgi:hypothetical protein